MNKTNKTFHFFLSGLITSALFFAVSCNSTENLSDDEGVTYPSSNVAPQIPSNTSRGSAVTDINPSLSLIDHIRLLSGVQVRGHAILVRGANNLTGNNNPLFVVDGLPFGYNYADVANSVSMYNVSSVRLVQGSELTRRFGSRGSTGVIEILTMQAAAY